MRIELTSVFVDDQRAALAFYTDVLGFTSTTTSRSARTPGSPCSPRTGGAELLLEPSSHPAVGPYRDALVADGIPLAQFAVDDLVAEHARLTERGVVFTQPPTASAWRSSLSSTTPAATSFSSSRRRRTRPTTTPAEGPTCGGRGRWARQIVPQQVPKSAPANCRTCAYSSELSTEALQRRGEPDLGWLMRHGAARTRDEWTLEGDRMGTDDKIDNKADELKEGSRRASATPPAIGIFRPRAKPTRLRAT